MNIDDAFPSEYLAANDLDADANYTLVMGGVEMREMTDRQGRSESKPVLSFRNAQKCLVLNRTNAATIAEAYGSDTNAWAGKRITLFKTKERAFGELMDCLRVRIPTDASKSVPVVDPEPEQAPVQQQELPGNPRRPTQYEEDAPF